MAGFQSIIDAIFPDRIATVTAAGALKVDGSGAGGGTVTLGPGSAIVGKVGIDQTTPGTTNGVQTLAGSTTTATGTTSNAGSGVATSAANLPAVAYVYGKNGSVWDPLDTTTPAQTYVSNSFLNVAAGTATTVVKSGAGTFASVVINTVGIGNTLTIYDNTAASGTKIATINTAAAVAGVPFTFNVAVGTGITCISAGGTGADYTVTYR